MKSILSIFFLLFQTVCFGQAQISDFDLSLQFSPSFIFPSSLTISHRSDTSSAEIIIYNDWDKKTLYQSKRAFIANEDINTIADFLKTYKFRMKGSSDTISFRKELIDGDSITVYSGWVGTDGITVKGMYNGGLLPKSFAFWTPFEGSENDQLMGIIFSAMYKSFSDNNVVNYLEELESYFAFSSGIRKISNNPIKYRLYGFLSIRRKTEIKNLIDALPSDQKIIIDLSNFEGMNKIFYPSFKHLKKRNDSVFWIDGTEAGHKFLKKINVKKRMILK